MKILHVIPNLGIGGTEKILWTLCKSLPAPLFEHRVISLKQGGETQKKLQDLGVKVKTLNSPDSFWQGIFDLRRLKGDIAAEIREFSPDVLHTWLTRANFVGRHAAQACGFKSVVSSLRVMESEKLYHIWAERFTQIYAQVITVNSSALADFAARKILIPRDKIQTIFNGVDVESFKDCKKTAVERELVVGSMGRLHAQKGMDVFLTAAKKVLEQFPRAKFIVAGDGPEKSALLSQVKSLGIEKSVEFMGWAQKSSDFYKKIDIFVLASRWEGMPNVVLEAMAAEKPIISTNVAGISDIFSENSDGIIIKSENPEILAEKIKNLIENSDFREKLAQRAQEKVKNKFKMETMVEEYRKLYEKIKK